jgi:hypothetical protein
MKNVLITLDTSTAERGPRIEYRRYSIRSVAVNKEKLYLRENCTVEFFIM